MELTVESWSDDGCYPCRDACVEEFPVSDVGPLFRWERSVGREVMAGGRRSVDQVPPSVILRQTQLDQQRGDGELSEDCGRREVSRSACGWVMIASDGGHGPKKAVEVQTTL